MKYIIVLLLLLFVGCKDESRKQAYNQWNTTKHQLISIIIVPITERAIVVCNGMTDDAYVNNVKFVFDANITYPTAEISRSVGAFTLMTLTFKDRAQYIEYVKTVTDSRDQK